MHVGVLSVIKWIFWHYGRLRGD